MANDLTEGRPSGVIIRLSLPLLLSTLIQQLYTMADSAIVGNLDSSNGLAAIGAAYPVTLVVVGISTGFGMGCSVVVSQLFGAKEIKRLKDAVTTITISALVLGAVVAVLGFSLAGPFMKLLGCQEAVFDDAKAYVAIYSLGAFPLMLYNASNSVFTGLGDAKRPLYFLIISSVLNVILDVIAVGPMGMGVRGAAWATVISQVVAAILAVSILNRKVNGLGAQEATATDGTEASLVKADEKGHFSRYELRSIISIALPSILQQITVAIGHSFLQSIVNRFDPATMAGYEVGAKIVNTIYMCFNSLGTALASFTGQNYGAGKMKRIRQGYRNSIGIYLIFTAVIVIIIQIFASPIASLFVGSTDANYEQVMEVAVSLLKTVSPDFFIISIIISSGALMRGLGDIKIFFGATVVDLGLRVGMSFILCSAWDSVTGIFWAWYVGSAVDAILCIIWYIRKRTRGCLKTGAI